MNVFGLPGIGGSLGQCAYCGESFISEILTGKKTVNFRIQNNLLSAHHECFEKYKACQDWRDFPVGPLRSAAESAEGEQP